MCKNPALAAERARKREELLLATDQELAKVVASVSAGRLKGKDAIMDSIRDFLGKGK